MPLLAPASPTRRHLLEISDLDASEFDALLDLAATMKHHPLAWRHTLEGRTIACVFHARSLTAHTAIATAINRLGALPVMLTPDARPEDDARLLSSACDGIVIYGARHRDLSDFAAYSSVPVVNAQSREHDPCHALAHCLALRERFGTLAGLSVAYVGPAGGLAHALLQAAPIAQFELRLASPVGAMTDPWLLASAGRSARVFDDPGAAVAGAHAVVHREEPLDRTHTTQALLRALITGDWEVSRC
jgi:ornithine carbamoyltransferase